MVTQVYAHILDEDRKVNAQKFEMAFYANADLRGVEQRLRAESAVAEPDSEILLKQLEAKDMDASYHRHDISDAAWGTHRALPPWSAWPMGRNSQG